MRITLLAILALVLAGCNSPSAVDANLGTEDGQPEPGEPTTSSTTTQSSTGAPSSAPRPNQPSQPDPVQPNETTEPGRNWTRQPWTLAGDGWAKPEAARIYPGVQVASLVGGCTVNFVFINPNATKVYVGTAGHCLVNPPVGDNSPPPTEAGQYCKYLPPAPAAEDFGAYFGHNLTYRDENPAQPWDAKGVYVYNSWLAMKASGETDNQACSSNDFAIIEVDPEYIHLVNPTMAGYAGPHGIAPGVPATGDKSYTSGGTHFRQRGTNPAEEALPVGMDATRHREGIINDMAAFPVSSPWYTHAYYTSHCLPGDSGSPTLDDGGQATGLVTAMDNGRMAACRITLLQPALDYMASHGGPPDLILVDGLTPFTGGLLP